MANLGMVNHTLLLLVAHILAQQGEEEEQIRIISARRATKLERKIYEQNI